MPSSASALRVSRPVLRYRGGWRPPGAIGSRPRRSRLTTAASILVALGLLAPSDAPAAAPLERATFDSAGQLTSLLEAGTKLAVTARLAVDFPDGGEVTLQPDDPRSQIKGDLRARHWEGDLNFPRGGSAAYSAAWTDADDGGVTLNAALTARAPLDVRSADCIIDVPRPDFQGGRLEPAGVALSVTKPDDVIFYRGETDTLTFVAPASGRTLLLHLDRPLPVTVTDRWDATGRSYRVRIALRTGGGWPQDETVKLALMLRTTAPAAAAAPVHLRVDPAAPLYAFDGFGANYCWARQGPVTEYVFTHLQQGWTRHELKAVDWDEHRAAPGPALTRDFELMQRVQRLGLPWVLSVWHLPPRFYVDATPHRSGVAARRIVLERWDELLELFGSYLQYLKENYAAEPDLFSFNESDLGIDIHLTPEEHRDAIKRLGASFAARGLKTKLLLGDTSNPRDTHRFVLATATDAEAMRYVGALSVHSWGGGTPAQYTAWGDVAEWLRLPLLVAEAGVDPSAYHNSAYDSYDYGLAEASQQQDLLRYARPTASLYWQFTSDYALAHARRDGTVEPTGRFWLMKHFTDLTPHQSHALISTSDQPSVKVSAFARGEDLTVHALNLGPSCQASIEGLPAGAWRVTTTTEADPYVETTRAAEAPGTWELPARSLTTLVRERPLSPR